MPAAKHAVLTDEARHVSDRRSNLNDALSWSAARWAVDQAIAAGATAIYVEDLRSMEARGMGRTLNTRLSQQVRGQIVDRMRHLAAEVGIAVVTVPARNTSRHCPRCLVPLRHRKAPDRPTTPGWKWALYPACGYQGDRDAGAWQRIAARGLTHQAKTVTDRVGGAMVIRSGVTPSKPRPWSPGHRHNQPEGPVQDRPHLATDSTSDAQATPDTLPHRAPRPGGPASGGTRSHGPNPAAPRSPPAPGRDDDQHTHHQPSPATRGSTGRGLPPARPRCPSTVGRTHTGHYVRHGIT